MRRRPNTLLPVMGWGQGSADRNLVRQATVRLSGGEEDTTEEKTNLWTTIIMFSPFVLTIFSVLIVFLYLLYGSVSG